MNWMELAYVAAVGLIVGSFLNVVIWRVPQMLENRWSRQDALAEGRTPPEPLNLNLALPGSFCPACKSPIRWYHNIPLLSYACLGGKCGQCHSKISARYPIIEALTGVLTLGVYLKFGMTFSGLFLTLLLWGLIALCFIDLDHLILPDAIVWPLMMLGFIAGKAVGAAPGLPATFMNGVIGAGAAYLFLWGLAALFTKLTHKEGMGMGDFKLLAALGAWLGWQGLIPLLLLASLYALSVVAILSILGKFTRGARIPFGPYLCLGAWSLIMMPSEWLALWWKLPLS
jgi:leader peptidase (prepilin peptidase) / N-methyltransferase